MAKVYWEDFLGSALIIIITFFHVERWLKFCLLTEDEPTTDFFTLENKRYCRSLYVILMAEDLYRKNPYKMILFAKEALLKRGTISPSMRQAELEAFDLALERKMRNTNKNPGVPK